MLRFNAAGEYCSCVENKAGNYFECELRYKYLLSKKNGAGKNAGHRKPKKIIYFECKHTKIKGNKKKLNNFLNVGTLYILSSLIPNTFTSNNTVIFSS